MARLHNSVSAALRAIGLAALLVAGMAMTLPEPAGAGSLDVWTVTEASGETLVRRGGSDWQRLPVDAQVPPGSEIRTGPDGVLTIARGGDRVTFSPGSQALIPETDSAALGLGVVPAGGVTPAALTTGEGATTPARGPSLIQRAGVLLFDMESRESRDFVIETPVLAAAIKGTAFTITVETDHNLVNVAEGLVEVTVLANGLSLMVEPGQMASVAADDLVSAPTILDRQALLRNQATSGVGNGARGGLATALGEAAVDLQEASGGFVGQGETQTAALGLDEADTLRSNEIDSLQTSTSGSSGTGGDVQEADAGGRAVGGGKGAKVIFF
jgi:hypothetical protein